ncbi:MAG: hypothetical protein IPO92_20460 [Saprospiraceae bacterium]|nr:hypothetical protein [Saprospiraceae bacterium]
MKAGKITANATFPITIADYNISVPSLVKDQIAKTVSVNVSANLGIIKINIKEICIFA